MGPPRLALLLLVAGTAAAAGERPAAVQVCFSLPDGIPLFAPTARANYRSLDAEAQVLCEINDILFVGRSRGHWLLTPYYNLLRWRWRRRYFKHYWEGTAKRLLANSPLRGGLGWLTRRLVTFNRITHKGPEVEASGLAGS